MFTAFTVLVFDRQTSDALSSIFTAGENPRSRGAACSSPGCCGHQGGSAEKPQSSETILKMFLCVNRTQYAALKVPHQLSFSLKKKPNPVLKSEQLTGSRNNQLVPRMPPCASPQPPRAAQCEAAGKQPEQLQGAQALGDRADPAGPAARPEGANAPTRRGTCRGTGRRTDGYHHKRLLHLARLFPDGHYG